MPKIGATLKLRPDPGCHWTLQLPCCSRDEHGISDEQDWGSTGGGVQEVLRILRLGQARSAYSEELGARQDGLPVGLASAISLGLGSQVSLEAPEVL